MPTDQSKSLGQWFDDWHLPLRRFLRHQRAGSPADIEDIAQEVFLRLLRYDRAELIENPRAYLYKIAANVAAEWATRSSRSLPHNADWLDELVDEFGPEPDAEVHSADALLLSMIDKLPPRSREILRLHFGEGLTIEAIAGRLRVTRRVVKRDLARAYATLRAALDPSMVEVAWVRLRSGRRL